MIQFVSGTIITFSQRGAAKIKSKQFSEFGSQTIRRGKQGRREKRLANFALSLIFMSEDEYQAS